MVSLNTFPLKNYHRLTTNLVNSLKMSTSEVFSGFCVFCYQSIYVCAKATNSSESVIKFTKFIGRLTGQNRMEKLLKGDDDECELNSELKLQCCNECNIIIDGFCNYYHQFKVLELQMNWKLEQLVGIINHCNKVPSRWKKMSASLEETFPDDMEIRRKSQFMIRKYRQAIEETCRQMYLKDQACVLLETSTDFTAHIRTNSQFVSQSHNKITDMDNPVPDDNTSMMSGDIEIDEEICDNGNQVHSEYLDLEQCTSFAEPPTQIKLEDFPNSQVSDDHSEIETQTLQELASDSHISTETTNSLQKSSAHRQQMKYSLRRNKNRQFVKLEDTDSDHASDDAEYYPELDSEQGSSGNDSDDGSENQEDDELGKKLISKKGLKSNIKITKSFSKDTKLDAVTGNMKCEECGLIFILKEQYWLHRSEDHEHVVCTICGKEFRKRDFLKIHLIFHKNPTEWDHECGKCGKKCPTNAALKIHLKTVHSAGPIVTPEVKKSEKSLKPDKRHVKRQLPKYRCGKCMKWFKNPEVFKNHENSHVEGTFQCKFCPHLATNVLKLSTHEYQNHCPDTKKEQDQQLQSNEASAPFCWSCPRCEYKSTGIVDYQLHFAQVHFNLEQVLSKTCPKCGKQFERRRDLLEHMERYKDKKDWKWQCDGCGKKFPTSRLLRRHAKWHSKDNFKYKCTQCGKQFIFRSKLEEHVKTHSKKPDKPLDKKSEALEKLGVNTKSKQCEICGKGFVNFFLKIKHLKKHHGLPEITDKSKRLYCDIDGCTVYFMTKNQLFYHQVSKHEEKETEKEELGFSSRTKECEICGRVMFNWSKKVIHMKEHHDLPGIIDKSKYIQCTADGCAAYFKTKLQLIHHRVSMHEYKFKRVGKRKNKRAKINN